MISFMDGYQKKNKGMNAGMGLVLGFGIGAFIGAMAGTLMANRAHSFAGGFDRNDLKDQNYEFGQEYGISGTPSGIFKADGSRIDFGHGLNYGVSGYGSGLNDSQTNINKQKQ